MHHEHLSDDEVLSTVTRLTGSERGTVARIVSLIREVEDRRIHLREAYSSIYDFCFRALKLSEGEASRRVHVARMSKRFPQVLEALASGAVNLTNLDLLRDVMTEENADILVEGATGRTKHEVEVLVACLDPKPDVPSNITRLRDTTSSNRPWQPPPKALSPGRSKIQMTGDDELCAMIARAQQLTRHENPSGDMAIIFKAALAKLLPILEKENVGEGAKPRASKPPKDPRDVSAAMRREVIARDGEQCSYVSPCGERCRARAWLEIDHRHARALGGVGTLENLRLLCAAHNHYEAERTFGRAHIEEKIAERRAAADRRAAERRAADRRGATGVARDPRIAQAIGASTTRPAQSDVHATLKSALVGLGFRAKEVERAILTLPNDSATTPIEGLLRIALATLTPSLRGRA